MMPTKVVNGVSVYVRDSATVDAYCRAHVRADNLAPVMYGCYVKSANLIMVEEGRPEVLAHELRHVDGWEHRGECHSTKASPDGVKLDGTPCDWYRP